MRIAALYGFDQFLDNMRRRRLIRITHTEIDDIFTAGARLGLQIADDIEDVRW